jgi:phospholipid/cholesterol/gamma-HCH transport system permease protein
MSQQPPRESPGALEITLPLSGEAMRLVLRGRLDSETIPDHWREAMEALENVRPDRLIVDAEAVDYCDGVGAGLLIGLRRAQEGVGRSLEIRGLREEFQQLVGMLDPGTPARKRPRRPSVRRVVEDVGEATGEFWGDVRWQVAFIGEAGAALVHAIIHPRKVRWKDALLAAEAAGADAIGIVATIGFLLGLILAFQSAVPMRKFGTEIFVTNLVALSVLRELGPLVTAIILAGRTGSALAAELGTMKVNEELDALTTMGLDPVRFLVTTRLLAAVVVMPLLVVFLDLLALVGAGVVMTSLGIPLVKYLHQVHGAVTSADLIGGLAKSLVFGLLVAGVGCLRGLQAEAGSRGVGTAATGAVVSGIFLIVIADGVFAILFYLLEI